MLHKTFLDMFVICSVASVNWNYSGVSKNTWSTLFAKSITTKRFLHCKTKWRKLVAAQSTMGVCKSRNRPATPLGHPGIPWNTPLTGWIPPGLPLMTKMRQKTLKYLQWINKYVLSVTEKTEIGSDWQIHPNYEIFSTTFQTWLKT